MSIGKFLGMMYNATGHIESPLYFISEDNLDGKIINPRIPDNFLTRNGYEDNTTKRVCFCMTIEKCLMALSQKCTNREFNVYVPDGEYTKVIPTVDMVPDCKATGEVWIMVPVKLKLLYRIKCTGPARSPGIKYKYGNDKIATLYRWSYTILQNNQMV